MHCTAAKNHTHVCACTHTEKRIIPHNPVKDMLVLLVEASKIWERQRGLAQTSRKEEQEIIL